MRLSVKQSQSSTGVHFIVQADIEGQVSCSVSASDGLSLVDILSEKLELTGGRKWFNFLVYTKQTRTFIEWEMNVRCIRGHALVIINKMDPAPPPLPGAHHFLHPDMIPVAIQPHSHKDYCYIIRPSAQTPGSFALAITTPSDPNGSSNVRHVKIGYDTQTNKFSLCSKYFDDLDSLVAFFKNTPIKAHNGPNMYLKYPVPVDQQLDEDCKQRCRLTRSGQRLDTPEYADPDCVSLWSCSSTYNTPSYSYDGSASSLSDNDCGSNSSLPGEELRSALSCSTFRNSDRGRSTTVVSQDQVGGQIECDGSKDSQSNVDNDVLMRGQSSSSSSTGGSFGSVGYSSRPTKRPVSIPSAPISTSPRPHMAGVSNLIKRCSAGKPNQRPHSEIIQKLNAINVEMLGRSSTVGSTPNLAVSDRAASGPEETYMEMVPETTKPDDPLARMGTSFKKTIERRPPGASRENGGTLTRDGPEETYMQMEGRTLGAGGPSVPDETYTTMTLADLHPPEQTYVDMQTISPNTLRRPVLAFGDNHTYANRPSALLSPAAVYQNTKLQDPSEHFYENTHQGLDPITATKLIANVQNLMATVQQQSTDILTLKKTVKELKLTVDELQNRVENEEFDYDH